MDVKEIMKPYRARIDALDDQIVDLLVERTQVIAEVGHLKHEKGIPSVIQSRVDEVRERNAERAAAKGMNADIVREIYARLIDFSCNLEDEIRAGLEAADKSAATRQGY